ncbi:hypothetical protein VQ643_07790 [Pseudomonas sp. F1_0610]|uniref:hypothetical protein n=1 Tax=Pseudomonas sp. F1_0610 TaxID=3114284 RepID=UPI0039C1A259
MLAKDFFSRSGLILALSLVVGFILVVDAYRGYFSVTSYFLPFLMYIWLPQLAVVGVLLFFRPKMIFLAGVSLAMDIYLAVLTRLALAEAAFWVTYLSSFLGIFLGAYAGLMFLRMQQKKQLWLTFVSGFLGTGLGILAGFLLLVRL